ncbi:DnaK-type molecular chaperone BiP [Fasciola gigantica]|uniref:DnaK-type molecular chaperone BiP n=1 Tax=Fasciola gigantica TaxID=46835 RepID=A0A504Z5E0_FASGI|nr:DnaK-type molecular chaperone BiP [Fasciola gigantica]
MPTIGIDLGTTYCCVATFQNGVVEIIPNDQGNLTTPSYVAFTSTQRLVGEAAKEQATRNPSNTVYDAKRLIGRRIDEVMVKDDRINWPFDVIHHQGKLKIRVEVDGLGRLFLPEEISSMLLDKMKQVAEAYLGTSVIDAVVTVPAYFNNTQRQATKDAGIIAGLNVLRVISEPTAAAIAYGLDRTKKKECNVLVYDLGGGTFDVSVLTINNKNFMVKSTCGDTHLGGQDFDQRLIDHCVHEFERQYDQGIRVNKSAMHRLRIECERVKRLLSCETEAQLEVEDIHQGITLRMRITRAKFEELNMDLFRKTLEPLTQALKDAQLQRNQIDEVLLVGGSTRIPMIRKLVKEYFDGRRINTSVNPDEAVARGAALQAAKMSGEQDELIKDLEMKDVTPLSLGTELYDGRMRVVIRRNTPIPITKSKGLQTTRDNQSDCPFSVYEGERVMAADNHLLASFELTGLTPAKRGLVKFDLTFHVDEDGILTVAASERGTDNQEKIKITQTADGLTEEDVKRMRLEAERFKALDEDHHDRMLVWHALETCAYSVKRRLDSGNKCPELSDVEREIMRQKCEETMNWLCTNRLAPQEMIESKMSELEEICRPVLSVLHQ